MTRFLTGTLVGLVAGIIVGAAVEITTSAIAQNVSVGNSGMTFGTGLMAPWQDGIRHPRVAGWVAHLDNALAAGQTKDGTHVTLAADDMGRVICATEDPQERDLASIYQLGFRDGQKDAYEGENARCWEQTANLIGDEKLCLVMDEVFVPLTALQRASLDLLPSVDLSQ